jgi:hypothetical protein
MRPIGVIAAGFLAVFLSSCATGASPTPENAMTDDPYL